MLFKDIPIQRKLMTVILLTSGAVLILTCVAFFAYEFHTFRQSTVRQLSTLGEIIGANSTAALAFESPEDANEILAALMAEQHILAAILYDKEGNIFSKYPATLTVSNVPIQPKLKGYRFVDSYLEGFQPVIQGTRRLGTLYLKSDLRAIDERFRLYGIIAVLVIAVSSLLAYLLSKILQKSISKPILALAETAKAISDRQDYSVRATKLGNDELGSLTDAFNHMLMQIQEQNLVLSGFNKNLEHKVMERTIELEIVNKEQKEVEKKLYEKNNELAQALEELQSAKAQLIELNNKLERRVEERTNELLVSEEELIIKNHELKKINIDLDNFIYTASHDLKSPICNIEGLTSLLNKMLDNRLENKERNLMEMISRSIAKFKGTIEGLTEITKVQKNLEYEVEDVSFKEAIEDVKDDIRDMMVQAEALIREDLQVNRIIYARHNLRSIVYNLLSNAIKYRSPERPLKVAIKTYDEGGHTVLSIEDNGLGINEKNLPKLFTMFKRLHTHVEGAGIGLYIIKRTIENKGGRIEVESKLDEGTRFKVYFK
ncbi:MAG: ATP-binding protein [Bacteroidota bacterium]